MLRKELAAILKRFIVALAAFVIAVLVLLGTAFLTDHAGLLIAAALLALSVVNLAGQFLVDRRMTRSAAAVQGASLLALLVVFYVAVLMPTPGVRLEDLPGVKYWDLSTGSRIAYTKIAPVEPMHPEPIIFVHGGPGTPDMEGDAAYFGRLREEGYVVYLYDELGAGRSSRLDDPRGYSVERDAADLEAIRQQIGADKIILIGHSYGASVAAFYIAQYGDHVAKFIASSPGALVGGVEGSDLRARLTTAQAMALYSQILQPRALTVYLLLQINPRAAHSFAGDAEMDVRNDGVYAAAEPGVHCAGKELARRVHGTGFYANQFPQSAQRAPVKDIRAGLNQYKIPTLVIKGSCDYLTWASGLEYVDAFQRGPAQLVYLSGAGHNAYQDRPDEYEANVRAFLSGRPLPNEYVGRRVPPDYEKGR